MKYRSNHTLVFVLLTLAVGILLFLATAQTSNANSETETGANTSLANRLLPAGCIVGLAVVLILVITQIRGRERKAEPNSRPAKRKAMPDKTMAFKCKNCGRVFRKGLTEECRIECPLCGHVWKWPPPIQLKLLEDRMSAFALDPNNPRGDLTLPTKVISRLSKSFAERMLVAGQYLEPGEILCICEECRGIHITQRKNRGLLGICVECRSVLLIW